MGLFNRLSLRQKIGNAIDRVRGLNHEPRLIGTIRAQIIDKDGNIRWEETLNGVTTTGFNLMLDSTFRSASITPLSTWYIGLVSNSGFSALSVNDTMSSHTSWTEDYTHYTASVRPTWTPTAAASKSITNTSSVNFAINTDNTIIKGIFVASDSTLNGTTGTLWSAGLFSSDQTLFNGDTLKITYTVTLQ